jgi:transmembrane E3 ubiquitin-protein ligase
VPSLTTARLARQRYAHGVLSSSEWGDFVPRTGGLRDGAGIGGGQNGRWLNLTGFRQGDGLAWDDLDRFKRRCLEWSRHALGLELAEDLWEARFSQGVWHNATGVVNGEWIRRDGSSRRSGTDYNLTAITPDVSWTGQSVSWSRNVTGSEGKMLMRIEDKAGDFDPNWEQQAGQPLLEAEAMIRQVDSVMTLQDDWGSGMSWDMHLHGVHWPKHGALLLTTTSEKFAGIFGLPHLSPGPRFFNSSRFMLNRTLDEVLRRKEKAVFSDPGNPWASTIEAPAGNWKPTQHCEYVVYMQLHPLSTQNGPDPEGLINAIESELRDPLGAPIPNVPALHMSALLWSPDCSYFLETKGPPNFAQSEGHHHLVGMKQEMYLRQAKTWLLAFAAVLFGQIQLLKAQMRDSGTPSTMARVSFLTASFMLMADGLVFAGSSAWSLSAGATFLPSLLVAFAAFLSMTIGGFFLSEIYKVQEPERRNRDGGHAGQSTDGSSISRARTPQPAATTARSASPNLPGPVAAGPAGRLASASTDSAPIIIPSDQDIDAEIAANVASAGRPVLPLPRVPLLPIANAPVPSASTPSQRTTGTPFSAITGRFVLIGTCLVFVSLAATSWPSTIRAIYSNALAFVYLSLWLPQIFRNIQRNSRRAFSWQFMIGQSIFRLLPFAYFYLKKDNILFAEPDSYAFIVLAGWIWVQLWILAFQDVLGPRFGIPKSWTPEAWDYHPILREDSLEAGGLPIGLMPMSPIPGSPISARRSFGTNEVASADTREREKEKEKEHKERVSGTSPTAAMGHSRMRSIECAVCQELLEVPVVKAGQDDPAITGVAGVFARRLYMVTPCRHIFHSACLEGWLRFRLQCPICREELPPL